jgi:DNA-binding LytR/AlgR family response regulator
MSLLALIVDDEAPARAELRYLLDRHGGVEVVGEAASVREALALAARVDYDVVFLDINLPDLTGIDAARALGDWPRSPAVVFVTAHDDHAVQAFAVDAIDYLLKPVAEDRLATSIARVKTVRSGEGPGRSGPAVVKVPATVDGETVLLDPDEIEYAEADGDRTWVVAGGRRLPSRSMRELEDLLPPTVFFRIHRSAMVNLRKVVALETVGPGRFAVRLTDGTKLEVARRQTKALRRQLGLAG